MLKFGQRLFSGALTLFCLICVITQPLPAADLAASGWRLWPDTQASWQKDTLYLPDQVPLNRMPVNPPTGGWSALHDRQGIPVTLPSTVEEHYWGKFGYRPYGGDYKYGDVDKSLQNGNYRGVSWWWRHFRSPAVRPGQRLLVHFRGARLRAEVYCNGTLCGYTILTETPFDADITQAVHAGQDNVLAVRITNPGGQMDWRDSNLIPWGSVRLPSSHGFGGLDAGIAMEVRDPAAVADLAVFNQTDARRVQLQAEVESPGHPFTGNVVFQISRAGKTQWTTRVPVTLTGAGNASVSTEAALPHAALWTLEHPALYHASARLEGLDNSEHGTDFGFRWFTAEGIGTDARLMFNGKRIVLRSSISWGFWGPNGLWPDAEKAQKEVEDAKAFGLNCLQFHRNIGKPLVLDTQDRLGLLRYEEPGCGRAAIGGASSSVSPAGPVDTSGVNGAPQDFTQQYEEDKILAMVRRDRSHPSLIMYCVQNELGVGLESARIFELLRRMHAIDPSRILVLHSGIKPINQAWFLPYEDAVRVDDGNGFSGWRDEHTVGGQGTYQDILYTGPEKFSHDGAVGIKTGPNGQAIKPEIMMWGEMLGSATPDDHQAIVDWYRKTGRAGYDREDHEKILAAYNDYLDRYGFRQAFPTAQDLFRAVGAKSYFFWQKMVEQCRFSNRDDFIVISGWESTAIENHSGLVDAHRNFKADPDLIRRVTAPEMLAVRARHLVLAKGDTGVADVYLINEVGRTGPQRLAFTVRDALGRTLASHTQIVSAQGGDVYGQLLQAGLEFPAASAGMLTLTAALSSVHGPSQTLHREEQVLVVDVRSGPALPQRIAVVEPQRAIAGTLSDLFGIKTGGAADLSGPLDAVVLSAPAPAAAGAAGTTAINPDAPTDRPETVTASAAPMLDWEKSLDTVLPRVSREGVRLVLWTDTGAEAQQFSEALARRHIVQFAGMSGVALASWMGSWYFVRRHPLFAGLPQDCVMDWRYQVAADRFIADAPRLSAPGLEVVAGYGRDHQYQLGDGACVIPYGKGQIVLLSLPGLYRALGGDGHDIHPVIARRLLANALR